MKLKEQTNFNNSSPLLSIVCITYNHSNYINDAIESFLNQNVDFVVEILIHDDASTDGTNLIIKEFEKKYPHIIKPVYQITNQYSKSGFEFSFKELQRAKGKYIALCEGDDYWSDENKLQKQVSFLESNSDFSMCFHKVRIKNETLNSDYSYPIPPKDILFFKDILFKHFIPTCSLVFINDKLIKPLPRWLNKSKMCDIPIELFLADKGKTKYFDSAMAVYRLNSNSLTHNREHINNGRRAFLYMYTNLRNHFKCKYYIYFTLIILKNKLGYIKDFLGFNTFLKNNI